MYIGHSKTRGLRQYPGYFNEFRFPEWYVPTTRERINPGIKSRPALFRNPHVHAWLLFEHS